MVPADIRERLLMAAVALIREGGLPKLTQPRVAKAAGVSQSHLTYYFPTRADLVHAVLERAAERQRAGVEATVAAADQGVEALVGALAETLSRSENTRVLVSFVLAADTDPAPAPCSTVLSSACAQPSPDAGKSRHRTEPGGRGDGSRRRHRARDPRVYSRRIGRPAGHGGDHAAALPAACRKRPPSADTPENRHDRVARQSDSAEGSASRRASARRLAAQDGCLQGLGCRLLADQRVPVEGGVSLSADVYTPKRPGRYPAIVMFAAYSHELHTAGIPAGSNEIGSPPVFTDRGYAQVVLTRRGMGRSEGEAGIFFNRRTSTITSAASPGRRRSRGATATWCCSAPPTTG